jgi:RNA 3'-phosphate cyclase
MIEIDGSHGEGGGQILRTAVSLSALTMKPIRVADIRANRPEPGLKRQHLTGIELAAQLVNADTTGLVVGSTEIEFIPKERRGGQFSLDVGTAGSISLVLQTVLPPAVLSPEPVTFSLRGGTDVKWSPPVDYLTAVFAHALGKLGPSIDIRQKRRGHYPRGGGLVECVVDPVERLNPVDMVEFGRPIAISGISHCVRLPSHVAQRQASSAATLLKSKTGIAPDFAIESYRQEKDSHLGPGSGIVIWVDSDREMRLGADARGDRGTRAEDVGIAAAIRLLSHLATGKAVDAHLGDMIVPYLAVADGLSRIGVTEVTSHLATNIWTVRRILGTEIDLSGEIGQPGQLQIHGEGLSL